MSPRESKLQVFVCNERPLPPGTPASPRPADRPRIVDYRHTYEGGDFQSFDCEFVELPPGTPAPPRPPGRERETEYDPEMASRISKQSWLDHTFSDEEIAGIAAGLSAIPPEDRERIETQLSGSRPADYYRGLLAGLASAASEMPAGPANVALRQMAAVVAAKLLQGKS